MNPETMRELDRIAAANATEKADLNNLLRFAGQALSDCHIENIGDWDGGDIQDALVKCGLLQKVERTVPCSVDCRCADGAKSGELTDCYITTPLGDRAWGAMHRASTVTAGRASQAESKRG